MSTGADGKALVTRGVIGWSLMAPGHVRLGKMLYAREQISAIVNRVREWMSGASTKLEMAQ